jgi:NAD-dependent deacetylase
MTQLPEIIISQDLRAKWRAARKVLALTGAGVSAESGVPTFRGGGRSAVWKGMPFTEISSARMARENLPEVWEWFDYRRRIVSLGEPNPAHHALARWAAIFPLLTLVTQNIDGLHQRANSRQVLELHGNINRAKCEKCETRVDLPTASDNADNLPRPDFCAVCQGRLRPDVVLFGEMLPAGVFEQAAAAAQNCDLCFVIGASALVYPAASLPEIALKAGAYLVEINPEQTPLSPFCHETLTGPAGEILPLIERTANAK